MDTRTLILILLLLALLLLLLRGVVAVIADVRAYIERARRNAYAEAERAVGFCNAKALRRALRRQWWPPRRLTPSCIAELMRDAIGKGNTDAITILATRPMGGDGGGSWSVIEAAALRGAQRPDVLDAVLAGPYSAEHLRAHPLRCSDLVGVLRPGLGADVEQRIRVHTAHIDRAAMAADADKLADGSAKPSSAEPAPPVRRRRM